MNVVKNLLSQLQHDETGMVVSSELVLIATVLILPLVVGLSEVSCAINKELAEMSDTFSASNQVDIGWDTSTNQQSVRTDCDILTD